MKRYTVKDLVYKFALSGFGLFCCFFFIFGEYGIVRHFSVNKELHEKQRELSSLSDEIKALKQELLSWKADPYYMEKVAREELGMGYKDEVVYLLKSNTRLEPKHKAVCS
jgi:cell division protein FtsB